MPRWAAFTGLTAVVLALLLALARLSQAYVTEGPPALPAGDPPSSGASSDPSRPTGEGVAGAPGDEPSSGRDRDAHGGDTAFGGDRDAPETGTGMDRDRARIEDTTARDGPATDRGPPEGSPAHETLVGGSRRHEDDPDRDGYPPELLLANVALSQGVFGSLLALGAVYARIPPAALGLADRSPSVLLVGAGLGVGLYLANEVGAATADRLGVGHDERLRELLAPRSARGWILLLGVVLPVVAGVEELLFRAALVGAVPAGFGVSPWLMVGVSSVVFGLGHGAQGQGGVLVTGALGVALGAAFVLTGSLLAVFLAHYLVNALEFLVHEGPGIGPADRGGSKPD